MRGISQKVLGSLSVHCGIGIRQDPEICRAICTNCEQRRFSLFFFVFACPLGYSPCPRVVSGAWGARGRPHLSRGRVSPIAVGRSKLHTDICASTDPFPPRCSRHAMLGSFFFIIFFFSVISLLHSFVTKVPLACSVLVEVSRLWRQNGD